MTCDRDLKICRVCCVVIASANAGMILSGWIRHDWANLFAACVWFVNAVVWLQVIRLQQRLRRQTEEMIARQKVDFEENIARVLAETVGADLSIESALRAAARSKSWLN